MGILLSNGFIKNFSEEFIKYFLIIGFLGSFTTFSAFSNEVVELIYFKKIFYHYLYIFLSIFLYVSAAYIGIIINKF